VNRLFFQSGLPSAPGICLSASAPESQLQPPEAGLFLPPPDPAFPILPLFPLQPAKQPEYGPRFLLSANLKENPDFGPFICYPAFNFFFQLRLRSSIFPARPAAPPAEPECLSILLQPQKERRPGLAAGSCPGEACPRLTENIRRPSFQAARLDPLPAFRTPE
jgi:hypothetical protein